ncbi:Ammonia monooxygenase gamma subunit [BD1-7 clade bacterium]|uniref:Ammonia monooxygenase gamma subunit n=1 Tax=BD1-7 clade bacterium TaxID=2029982 RepID=A0A5S9N4E2_9GAMM|nr:Ammonia monooxygenase gamma subunit [BD1-7 clade bacterium]
MKKLIASLFLSCLSAVSLAAGGNVPLLDFESNLKDEAGLQRGAQVFMNYCMGCHSMKYMRYERLSTDLGVPADLVEQNLILDGSKIGSLMTNSAPESLQKKWFGAAPPDLTLVSRARGDAWLYSYLKGFYTDPGRPYGYNNLVFKDVGMPNVLVNLQGDQTCEPGFAKAANGGVKRDTITYEPIENPNDPCGRTAHVDGTGTLSPEEFDQVVTDLTNFLIYAGEPTKLYDRTFLGMELNKREVIGVYCLFFLVFFGVFAVLLNREYWKDVH